MREVKKRHHLAGGQTRRAGDCDTVTSNNRKRTTQIHILDLLARFDLASSGFSRDASIYCPGMLMDNTSREWRKSIILFKFMCKKLSVVAAISKKSRKRPKGDINLRVIIFLVQPIFKTFIRLN
jgi:hypothetical protein